MAQENKQNLHISNAISLGGAKAQSLRTKAQALVDSEEKKKNLMRMGVIALAISPIVLGLAYWLHASGNSGKDPAPKVAQPRETAVIEQAQPIKANPIAPAPVVAGATVAAQPQQPQQYMMQTATGQWVMVQGVPPGYVVAQQPMQATPTTPATPAVVAPIPLDNTIAQTPSAVAQQPATQKTRTSNNNRSSTRAETPSRTAAAPRANTAPLPLPGDMPAPMPMAQQTTQGYQSDRAYQPKNSNYINDDAYYDPNAGARTPRVTQRSAGAAQGVTAATAGIKGLQANTVQMSSGRTVRVGEQFGSGETLMSVDPTSKTIVTDQRRIVIFDN